MFLRWEKLQDALRLVGMTPQRGEVASFKRRGGGDLVESRGLVHRAGDGGAVAPVLGGQHTRAVGGEEVFSEGRCEAGWAPLCVDL